MNLLELVQDMRESLLYDTGGDRLTPWIIDDTTCDTSTALLVQRLEEARQEYLTRLPIIDSTSALTTATVSTVDAGLVTLDARILWPRSPVRLTADGAVLIPVSRVAMDRLYPEWREETAALPTHWVYDENPTQMANIRVYPAPTADVDITFHVARLAMTPLAWTDAGRVVEIGDVQAYHHRALAYYAAAEVLSDRNERQKGDWDRADRLLSQFDKAAGPRVTAAQLLLRKRLAAAPIRTGSHYIAGLG